MNSDAPSLRTRFPVRLLAAAMLATSAVFLWLAGAAYFSYRTAQRTWEEEATWRDTSGNLTHLNEVLSMSARLAAVSGGPEWEERY